MELIRLTHDLLAEGYNRGELARLTKNGDLDHVRRGAYAPTAPEALDARDRHRQLIAATVPMLASDAVVSHTSAAVLHGLPLFAPQLERVQVTRGTVPGGRRRTLTDLHAAPVEPAEVVRLAGVVTTSAARTVADLARSTSFEKAVVVGDAALRAGLEPQLIHDSLRAMRHWPGVIGARRVADFIDSRAESPGESRSRVAFHRSGIPAPIPQHEIFDHDGFQVGRVDFAWPDFMTVGEFDGKVKYGRLLKPGQAVEEVLYLEKLREDALRDLGWQVVRWTWADLYQFQLVAARLRRAFARARR